MPFTAASEIVLSTFFAASLAESTTDLRTAGDVLKSLAWRVKDVRSIDIFVACLTGYNRIRVYTQSLAYGEAQLGRVLGRKCGTEGGFWGEVRN